MKQFGKDVGTRLVDGLCDTDGDALKAKVGVMLGSLLGAAVGNFVFSVGGELGTKLGADVTNLQSGSNICNSNSLFVLS